MNRFPILLIFLFCFANLLHAKIQNVYAVGDSYKINKEGTKVWSLDPIDLAALKQKNIVWDAASKTITKTGAKNERVAFQILLEADKDGAKDVDVTATELKGPDSIPMKNIELSKVWYIKTTRESYDPNLPSTGIGWYPDALIPWNIKDYDQYDGPPFAIEPDTAQSIWVEVEIPKDAKPGIYKGKLDVLVGGKTETSLNLQLRVFNFAIPAEMHNIFFMNGSVPDMLLAGGFWLKDDAAKDAYENDCFKLARQNRWTYGNMYYIHNHNPESLRPEIKTDAGGNITDVDWTKYDARWGKVLDPKNNIFGPGEPPIEVWRLPIETGIIQEGTAKRFPEGDRAFEQFPKWIQKHWKEKGWDIDRAYIYLCDEPKESSFPQLLECAKKLRAATTPSLHIQMAILCTAKKQEDARKYIDTVLETFKGNVDFWLWSLNSVNPKKMREILPPTDWIGFYQGNCPYAGKQMLDSDGLDMRTWSWISWMYETKYCCYFSFMDILEYRRLKETKETPLGNTIWTNATNRVSGNQSKAVFVYPGGFIHSNDPIPNMRLKQIRRGQTDYEYMWLLSKAGKRADVDKDVREIIVKALNDATPGINQVGTRGLWNTDPEKWDAKVRAWGEMLDKAGTP